MKRIAFAVFVAFVGISLGACSKEPKTVEYYKQHEAERKAVLERFKDNPGKLRDDPDAINALEAETRLRKEHLYGGWTKKEETRVVVPTLDKLGK